MFKQSSNTISLNDPQNTQNAPPRTNQPSHKVHLICKQTAGTEIQTATRIFKTGLYLKYWLDCIWRVDWSVFEVLTGLYLKCWLDCIWSVDWIVFEVLAGFYLKCWLDLFEVLTGLYLKCWLDCIWSVDWIAFEVLTGLYLKCYNAFAFDFTSITHLHFLKT